MNKHSLRHTDNQTGFIGLKNLIVLLVVGLFFYSAAISMGIYYRYYTAKTSARDILTRVNYNPDEQLAEEYFKLVKKIGLPIKRKNYQFVREPGEVSISLKYAEKLMIGDYQLYEFKFDFKEIRVIHGEVDPGSVAEEEYQDAQ